MTTRELTARPGLAGLCRRAVLTSFTRRGHGELPETVYEQRDVAVDREHLAAYNRVCGFRLTDELPASYPHLLSFPLQVKLMTDPGFPFPLVGSVHVANVITQGRPLRVDEKPTLRVHVTNPRDHPKGRQFDVVSEALRHGEVVWTDVSTYLFRASAEKSTSARLFRASAEKSTSARLRRGNGSGPEPAREEPERVEPTAAGRGAGRHGGGRPPGGGRPRRRGGGGGRRVDSV